MKNLLLIILLISSYSTYSQQTVHAESETGSLEIPKKTVIKTPELHYVSHRLRGSTIEKDKVQYLSITVVNRGNADAKYVKIKIELPPKTSAMGDTEINLGTVPKGSQREVEVKFLVFNEFDKNSVPIKIVISENEGKFGDTENISLQILDSKGNNDIAESNKPVIKIITPEAGKGIKRTVQVIVSGKVTDESRIDKIDVNGQSAYWNGLGEFNIQLKLPEGKQLITVTATDEHGNTGTATRTVEVVKDYAHLYETKRKPNLYMVSIGVADYKNYTKTTDLKDLDFPAKDAKDMAALFKLQEGLLYNKVEVNTITDKYATREGILDAFIWLENKPLENDVAVIFISSHGFNEAGHYYVLPHNGDHERLRSTAVDFADIEMTITKLSHINGRKCRVLLFLDACNSGQLPQLLASKGVNDENLKKALEALNRKEYGCIVLASSTGDESSYETAAWGHGAFTLALLEALKEGKADYDNDDVIYYRELQLYVPKRVKQLTKSKQHPVTQNAATITEFPISVIK